MLHTIRIIKEKWYLYNNFVITFSLILTISSYSLYWLGCFCVNNYIFFLYILVFTNYPKSDCSNNIPCLTTYFFFINYSETNGLRFPKVVKHATTLLFYFIFYQVVQWLKFYPFMMNKWKIWSLNSDPYMHNTMSLSTKLCSQGQQ